MVLVCFGHRCCRYYYDLLLFMTFADKAVYWRMYNKGFNTRVK